MKTTGKLWNEYLASWPEDWWFEDGDEKINGTLLDDMPDGYTVKDDDTVSITYGCIMKGSCDNGVEMVSHFKRWLKSKNVTSIVCTIPNDFLDTFTAFAKANNIGLSK